MASNLNGREQEAPSDSSTTWGRSVTRQLKHLRPTLNKVKQGDWDADHDLEAGGIRHKGSKWGLYIMAFQTLGVVYGDIGTSPLYVFAGIFAEKVEATPENIIGTLSLIIWSITLVPLIKYALIVLRADDNGQGGSLALFSQLRRQGMLTARPRDGSVHSGNAASDIPGAGQPPTDWRQRFLSKHGMQVLLRIMVVFGVGLILGDGVLTPAVTVVSAFEGLQVAAASTTRGTIVAVSCVIIAGLFAAQRAGPSKLGFMFAPIVATYFAFNVGVGIFNIFKHQPSIFKAISPHYFIMFFIRNGKDGWQVLAGVLLAITGTEAMFADMQHFNQRSIFLGFTCICYPSIITMYLGQAAYLTRFPEQVSQTFWASLPGGKPLFWPMFIVVTLTSMVASQALISATFSIVSQAIKQGFFPKFTVIHTSKTHTGQIYVPVINWVLMVLTVAVVIGFQTSSRLSLAYGLAVVCDMLLTTSFLTLIMICVWRKNLIFPIIFFITFFFIETTFLSASTLKIPKGGWLSLMMAMIYAYFMLLWFWGASKKKRYFNSVQQSMQHFLLQRKQTMQSSASKDTDIVHGSMDQSAELPNLPGIGVYYASSIQGVPHVLSQTARLAPYLPEVCVFMTNRNVPLPEVLPSERLLVQQLSSGFFHVIVRYGYTETIAQGDSFMEEVMRHIQSLMYRSLRHRLIEDASLAPLASKCKLSKSAIAVVDSVVGDIYGEGHANLRLTQRNLASKNLAMSRRSLHTHDSRTSNMSPRPTILDEHGNLRTLSVDASNHMPAGINPSRVGGIPKEGVALINRATSHLTWPRSKEGSNKGAYEDFDTSVLMHAGNGVGSPALADVVWQTPTTRVLEDGPGAEGIALAPAPDDFEAQMTAWANEVRAGLNLEAANHLVADKEPLDRLAAELARTARAAAEGARAYVIGRSYATRVPGRGWKSLPRQYFLEVPFSFMQKNVESDPQVAFGLSDEKLLEVGLKYHL